MKPELIVDAPIMNEKKIWVKKINKPHFDHPFHFHKLCELTWNEKSHGKLIMGDYVGNFSEGEIILSSPGLPHLWRCDPIYYKKDKKYYTKACGIYFPLELVAKICDDTPSINRYNALMNRAERGIRFQGKTRVIMNSKIKEMVKSDGLRQLGLFLQIIDILSQSGEYESLASIGYKKSTNLNDIERFNEVYQFLLKNFHNDITLEEVANICSMSPPSFCRFFKQKTQKTFTLFLNELRIGHAKKLLQNENYSIKDICYECGYNNPVHFFSFFKRIVKQTPKAFRESLYKMSNN